jgi:hypothetical protein
MIANNRIQRFLLASGNSAARGDYLAERLDRHHGVSLEAFMQEALQNQLNSQAVYEEVHGLWVARPEDRRASPRPVHRSLVTEEDIRVHAWLNERLASLQRERQSLWSRIVRVFLGPLVP